MTDSLKRRAKKRQEKTGEPYQKALQAVRAKRSDGSEPPPDHEGMKNTRMVYMTVAALEKEPTSVRAASKPISAEDYAKWMPRSLAERGLQVRDAPLAVERFNELRCPYPERRNGVLMSDEEQLEVYGDTMRQRDRNEYEGDAYRAPSGQWSWVILCNAIEIQGGAGYETEDEALSVMREELPVLREELRAMQSDSPVKHWAASRGIVDLDERIKQVIGSDDS